MVEGCLKEAGCGREWVVDVIEVWKPGMVVCEWRDQEARRIGRQAARELGFLSIRAGRWRGFGWGF